MDEPTASMDAYAEKQFMHAMERVSQDRTMIMVTHKMSLLKLVDRIVVLEKGRILLDGPRDKVLEELSKGINAAEARQRKASHD